jgi:addiction module HigA family antidote
MWIIQIIIKVNIMIRRNLQPSHQGEILRELFIRKHGLTITKAKERIRLARGNLFAIVNERAGISPQVAIKLSKAFDDSAQFWINLQKNYDLYQAE